MLAVLLVLYVGSQLLSSVLMSVTADRNQRFIMIALPFVFVPFIQGFPAGLLVYWITTNFWTVGQQYVIRRGAGLPVLGAPGVGRTPPPARRPRSLTREARPKPKEPKAAKDAEGQAEAERQRGRWRGAGRAARAPDERSAAAATPAAQEEDRKAQMSSDVVESTVQEVLEEVVTALGLKGEVEVDRDGDVVTGTVHGHDLGLFIGRHGQTIDAVQHLVFRIVAHARRRRPRRRPARRHRRRGLSRPPRGGAAAPGRPGGRGRAPPGPPRRPGRR